MSKELKLKQSSYFIKIGFDACYNQMKKELDEKDKEIASLKEDLEIQKNLARQACFESNRAYAETEQWKKMFYDLVDKQASIKIAPTVIVIGKDNDVPTNEREEKENAD